MLTFHTVLPAGEMRRPTMQSKLTFAGLLKMSELQSPTEADFQPSNGWSQAVGEEALQPITTSSLGNETFLSTSPSR